MKQLLLVGAALLVLGASAEAQQNGRNNNRGNNANNNNAGNNGGATLPLPEGIESVVSIDALGILMAEVNRDGKRDLAPIVVRHIYSGGIARLFGGDSVPTAQFVSPGQLGGNNGNGGGQNNGGGFQGGGIGGGIGGGFQGGGFGGQGGGFQGGGIGGQTGGFGGGIGAFQMRRIGRGRN